MGHLSEQRLSQYICTLKENIEGFAISQSRRPRGSVQVHIQGKKGRLMIRVKNLRQPNRGESKQEPYYEALLISGTAANPVNVGIIEVDSRGEGERYWEFAADNIKNTGRSIEDFNRVLIAVKERGSHRSRGKIVLSGELELEVVESFEGLNMEKVDPFGQAMPNHHWWKFYPNHLFKGGIPEFNRDNSVTMGLEEADEIVETEEQEEPVESVEPGMNLGPVFRGHQLIGLHYDEKGAVSCLVHGIPGRFCAEDQPDKGSSGYVFWQPLPGQSYNEGSYGYWLVHIDPESGEVVFPRQETPPPGQKPIVPEGQE